MQLSDQSQSNGGQHNSGPATDMNFSDAIRRLWKYRISGVAIFVLSMLISISYLNIATHKYTATLVLTPADQSSSDIAGLSGLGSLVGVNLSNKQGSSFEYYDDAIKSEAVAEMLSRDPKIMTILYSNEWDKTNLRWREPASFVKNVTTFIKRVMGQPKRLWLPPSAKDLQDYIISNVAITQETLTQKYTLVYKNPDPYFAKYFLDRLNYSADEFLRSSSIKRAELYSKYIENKLVNVSISEYRESLVKSLSSYEKTKMMASSDASFAIEKFGNTTVSKYTTNPDVILTTFVNLVLGFVLWMIYVFGYSRFLRTVRPRN